MNRDLLDQVDIERSLGHDLRSWGRRLPEGAPAGVAEGFAEAEARGAVRRRPDRFVRKWLQLRVQALGRRRVINDDVTPDLLRHIDVSKCPVTRAVLTHGELLDTDWSVDRLNNDGAYAANNLAVIGTGANRAKGSRSYDEVFALSEKTDATDGLAPVEWLRMASIMLGPCFAANPLKAPVIPLAAPLPSHSARQAIQQVQYVFTHSTRRQADKNALIKAFSPTARDEHSAARLRMAAEAMHQGLKGTPEGYDAWLKPSVLQAFRQWWVTLSPLNLALAGEISRQAVQSSLIPSTRLASWHLKSQGRLP